MEAERLQVAFNVVYKELIESLKKLSTEDII